MSYALKGRLLKNLLVFFAKNRRFNVFFYRLSPNRGKKGKNSPWEYRQTPSAKIEHVGVYFAKMGCKIEDGFTDIFGFQVRCFVFDRSDCVWDRPFTTGLLIRFAAKRKMDETISPWRSHLFSSLILTLL